MTTSKPLQTSTDSIPDQSVTRSKLGTGGLVSILFNGITVEQLPFNPEFSDPFFFFTFVPTEQDVQYYAMYDGIIKKSIFVIRNNHLTANIIVTFRINGNDTNDTITMPAGTNGVFIFTPETKFNQADLLSYSYVCTDNTNALDIFCITEIDYDG